MKSPVQLYCQLLDCLNIIYMIAQITPKFKFQNLNFFISDISNANAIEKIMIFVNNIFKSIDIAKYLKSLFSAKLQEKTYQIIQTLYFVLETDTKITLLKNFFNGVMQILVCTNAAGMGIDILDIKYII